MGLSTADSVLAALQSYDLKSSGSGKWRCNNPFRPGSNSHAFSLLIEGPEKGAYHDFVHEEDSGSLYDLAKRLDIAIPAHNQPDTKRAYSGLADYATAHGLTAEQLGEAGWHETIREDRPALEFKTDSGPRWRFLDGEKPPYKHQTGYKSSWYFLKAACTRAKEQGLPLILCNGEISTLSAWAHGLAASAQTGGSERTLSAGLLETLQASWDGPILIALDCDDKGRQASRKLQGQLRKAGYSDVTSLDLNLGHNGDLADFCMLHAPDVLSALAQCNALPDEKQAGLPVPTGLGAWMSLSDLGNAQRLIAQHGPRLRYLADRLVWLIWDETRWLSDRSLEIERMAKLTVRSIYGEAEKEPDESRRAALAKFALSSESRGKVEAMIKHARSEDGIPLTSENLDCNPWLLNCLNGTLNLSDGGLQEHTKSDLLTHRVEIEYDPAASCPIWLAFLDQVMGGDEELVAYLQRAVGYSLTGIVSEQCLFFMYGSGRNGKSTFIEIVSALLGDYSNRLPIETLLSKSAAGYGAGATPELARLAGTRLVVTSETEEGRRLNEPLIKDLTGGDTITARFLYGNQFDFRPQHKLWIYGNHKPTIKGQDEGIWRRIHTIPFNFKVPINQIDHDLGLKLRNELPGILTWAMVGCQEWQAQRLKPPAAVQEATKAYRGEMDILGAWIKDCCTLHPTANAASSNLYGSYRSWCELNSESVNSQTRFSRVLMEKGFSKNHSKTGWTWAGIRLND